MRVAISVIRQTSGILWLSLWVPGWQWFLCSLAVPSVKFSDHSPSWLRPAWPLSSECPQWPLLLGSRQSASAEQPEQRYEYYWYVTVSSNLYPSFDVREMVDRGQDGLPLVLLRQIAVRGTVGSEGSGENEPANVVISLIGRHSVS